MIKPASCFFENICFLCQNELSHLGKHFLFYIFIRIVNFGSKSAPILSTRRRYWLPVYIWVRSLVFLYHPPDSNSRLLRFRLHSQTKLCKHVKRLNRIHSTPVPPSMWIVAPSGCGSIWRDALINLRLWTWQSTCSMYEKPSWIYLQIILYFPVSREYIR